jgi:hypothetical protein
MVLRPIDQQSCFAERTEPITLCFFYCVYDFKFWRFDGFACPEPEQTPVCGGGAYEIANLVLFERRKDGVAKDQGTLHGSVAPGGSGVPCHAFSMLQTSEQTIRRLTSSGVTTFIRLPRWRSTSTSGKFSTRSCQELSLASGRRFLRSVTQKVDMFVSYRLEMDCQEGRSSVG